MIAVHFKDVF